jgi:hypothetical protein
LCSSAAEADDGLYRIMPEVLLDDRQRHASLNHPGRRRVAQILDTRRLRESRPHGAIAAGLPSAVEELLCASGIARAVGKKKIRRGEIDDV